MIIKKQLKNGLEIYFNINENNNYSSIMMSFDIGWMQDSIEKSGLAHLFEHLVGKRTKKFTEKGSMSLEKSKLGITYNAMTTPDNTYYYQNSLSKHHLKSLELLLQSIYESIFDKDDLEGEKKVVLREYANYKENRQQYMWECISKNIFKDTSLSKNIFGTEETLSNVSINDFQKFYDNYKNTKNAKLLISLADINLIDDTLNFLEKYFFLNPVDSASSEILLERTEQSNDEASKSNISKSIEITKVGKVQADFAIVFRHNKFSSKEQICYEVLYYILATSWSSILFKKLRDELSLVYEIGMQNYNYNNIAFTYLTMSVKKEDIKQLREELLAIINKVDTYITDDVFSSAKNIWEFYYVSNSSPFKKNNEIRNALRLENNTLTDIEKEQIFNEITTDDIIKISKKIFSATPSFVQIS